MATDLLRLRYTRCALIHSVGLGHCSAAEAVHQSLVLKCRWACNLEAGTVVEAAMNHELVRALVETSSAS